ncbi:MAG: hypothetical protein ACE5KZ_05020 [Candidatus Scalinduaceae bacterium]
MKKTLFFTFLFIFVATAVITLLGITSVIKIQDKYLTPLFATLIIETIGAVIALYRATRFFDDDIKSKTAVSSSTTVVDNSKHYVKPKKDPKKNEIDIANITNYDKLSMDDYFRVYDSLQDRFLEQEKFVKKMDGQYVI